MADHYLFHSEGDLVLAKRQKGTQIINFTGKDGLVFQLVTDASDESYVTDMDKFDKKITLQLTVE